MKRVLFFGTFDPLHSGHKHAFAQARALGDYLIVVVAQDSAIVQSKDRAPHTSENERLARVAAEHEVDEAILGDTDPSSYALLTKIPFDILALGYDQLPSDDEISSLLATLALSHVRTVRLTPHQPERYKSSFLRE